MTLIKMTPKKTKILYRLFTEKVPSGTVKEITVFLEGNSWTSDTYDFLSDLRLLSILINNGEVHIQGKPYPTYKVSKEKLKEFWMRRIEYELSLEIVKDEYTMVF